MVKAPSPPTVYVFPMKDLRISTAGLMLGLSVTATYSMLFAAVARAPVLLLLAPIGGVVGWWLGRRRERDLVVSGAEAMLRSSSER